MYSQTRDSGKQNPYCSSVSAKVEILYINLTEMLQLPDRDEEA